MAKLQVPELCARLSLELEAVSHASPILAFDADGTLWSGDVTRDLVAHVMAERPLSPDGHDRLAAIALQYGGRRERDVYDQLAWLVLSYSLGRVPDAAAVESVVVAFAGMTELAFEDHVAEAIAGAGLRRRFRRELGGVFEWAKQNDVRIVVVSASPRLAVEAALREVGLTADAVLGVEPAIRGGRLIAELASPVLVRDAKREALRARIRSPVLAAFGDDVRDLALLSEGRLRIAVHPTPELLARSSDCGGLVVLDGAESRAR